MKVADLIGVLQTMPPDAEVGAIYDGFCLIGANHVWLSRGGRVVMVDHGDVVYEDDDRPDWAPTAAQDPFWTAPAAPTETVLQVPDSVDAQQRASTGAD